jgi:hypothetical protein
MAVAQPALAYRELGVRRNEPHWLSCHIGNAGREAGELRRLKIVDLARGILTYFHYSYYVIISEIRLFNTV